LIGEGLQGLLLIPPSALQPKGFILQQAVRPLIAHVEVDWRAQTKNGIAVKDAYDSPRSIGRKRREVFRALRNPPSFYRTANPQR
jgi:hypothetical protein